MQYVSGRGGERTGSPGSGRLARLGRYSVLGLGWARRQNKINGDRGLTPPNRQFYSDRLPRQPRRHTIAGVRGRFAWFESPIFVARTTCGNIQQETNNNIEVALRARCVEVPRCKGPIAV